MLVDFKRFQKGNAILFVIISMGFGLTAALMTFKYTANLNKLGTTNASLVSLDSTANRVNFLLSSTNQCPKRLSIVGGALAANQTYKAIIKDLGGNTYVQTGTVVGNLKYNVQITLSAFGRSGPPYSPGPRFLGDLEISATPANSAFNFFTKTPSNKITVFIEDDGAGSLVCSTQTLFTSYIGPLNAKSSLECLDVMGRPVGVEIPAVGTHPALQYNTCVIPATQLMPSFCGALGALMNWGTPPSPDGEGWFQDPVGQKLVSGAVSPPGGPPGANPTYASSSYCF